MQINGASSAYYPALDRPAGSGKTDAVAGSVSADTRDGQTLPADAQTPAESTRVSLSTASASASPLPSSSSSTAGDGQAGNTNADANANADSSHNDKHESAASTDETASPVKSFVYGTLGLEHPQQQAQDTDEYYSAGKWLAAALTVGGIISIFA
jgi:hypothetical protein